jgi:dihydrofolate reductase
MTTISNGPGRTVVANISLSLDGRVNGPGGDYDMSWIVPHALTEEARTHMVTVTTPATTALLGRKNYEGFGSYWPAVADDDQADPRDRGFARWLNAVEKVVFSTTLTEASWHNSRVAADPVATVRHLRGQEGGDIIVLGSASIIRSLLAAGEVDRLSISLCPELAGGGARLFDSSPTQTSWSLTRATPTASGSICLLYDRKQRA